MDEIKDGGICPITGWNISDVRRQGYNWIYKISCGNFSYTILISYDCLGNSVIAEQKNIIRWLLVNGKINILQSQEDFLSLSKFLLTPQKILETISEAFVPTTPKEKSEQLLALLNKVFPTFKGKIVKNDLFNLSFFHDYEEFKIYLDFLVDSNFIKISDTQTNIDTSQAQFGGVSSYLVEFKFQGINHLASLEESGRNSKNCFVAMSFSDDSKIIAIKEAIKAAVDKTGYKVIIINEKHVESDRTINDAIIAEIKRAKFVIADFTNQKRGVYFEAGYALGLGIPVIYCCDDADFKQNSHFDVNHYPHILYNTPEELEKKMIDKIRAWID